MIRYLHINWVANQVFNTSNSNVLGSLHVNVNVNVGIRVYMSVRAHEQTTNTLPPLYRQINREDRLVVREGVCVLGRKGRRRLSYLHTHLPP